MQLQCHDIIRQTVMDLFGELKNILNVISVVEIRSLFQQMTYKRGFGGDTFILRDSASATMSSSCYNR